MAPIDPIEKRSGRGGRLVEIHEYQQSSGKWLFMVTTIETRDGNVSRETTGFDTLPAAREAMHRLADQPVRSERPISKGGSTHVDLPNSRTVAPATPGGPPEVEQVFQPVETHPCERCGYAVGPDGHCRSCAGQLRTRL